MSRFSYCCALLITIFSALFVNGQKNDFIWLSGYDSDHAPFDTAVIGYNTGNIKMDFNQNPVHIIQDSIHMNFQFADVTMSNDSGALLFYTNGIYVNNAVDELIENGDSLNKGYVMYQWHPSEAIYGESIEQGVMAIQHPTNPDKYYLFHSFCDTINGTMPLQAHYSRLLYTEIDMALNGGKGKVISKNVPVVQDIINGEVQAVKHANGRDWWLLVQQRGTNCFYRILVDSTGPNLLPDKTCAGDPMLNGEQVGAMCFSPDGSKLVYLGSYTDLNIYDFDRCTGRVSNAKSFPLPVMHDSIWYAFGVAISPNSRFLYVSLTHHLYQLDLWSSQVFNTFDTIGIYNGTHLPHNSSAQAAFHMIQPGPDGKIYLSCGTSVPLFHVINNPDEKGALCNFQQDGVSLPVLSLCVPNYPNYRLGALSSSACDTLSGLNDNARTEKEKILKTFPNPATNYVVIDYGFTDWNKGGVTLEIQNELGQTAYTQNLPMYSGFQKIDVSSFAAGFYVANVKRKSALVATTKFVKQ